MKKSISLQITVLLLLAAAFVSCSRNTQSPGNEKIVLTSSQELYSLASGWAEIYCTINPDVDIEVLSASETRIAENMENTVQMSIVSSDFEPEIYDKSLWKMIVGRNIIVPVINDQNPHIRQICEQGISPAGLARLLKNPANTSWNELFEYASDDPVSLYMKNDRVLKEGVSRFLENDRLSFRAVTAMDVEDIVPYVQDDPYAIGICYLADILNKENKRMLGQIRILPIDRNGNGMIDYKEDVYNSMDDFARAAWIGKYPRKLSNNIYTVANIPPSDKSELAFLSWVVSQGQALLDNYGYVDLPEFESQANAKIIDSYAQPMPGDISAPGEPGFFGRPLPYVLTAIILFTLIVFLLGQRGSKYEWSPALEAIIPGLAFNEEKVEIAQGLYYDKSHTWAYMEKDGTVKIGIDDFLQRVTGPITRVKMKTVGSRVKKGRPVVSIIQDGKQLDISAPVTGKITEMNSRLNDDASLLNSSPSTEGWIYRIEPANWVKESQFLIMGNHYKQWLKTEFRRLKEFLADIMNTGNMGLAPVLQDGGEVREHILKDLGPECWEDFQTNFIDVPS